MPSQVLSDEITTERQIYDFFTSRGWKDTTPPNPRSEDTITFFHFVGKGYNRDNYDWYEVDGKIAPTFTRGAQTIIVDEEKGRVLLLEPNYYRALKYDGRASADEVFEIGEVLNNALKAKRAFGPANPVRNEHGGRIAVRSSCGTGATP